MWNWFSRLAPKRRTHRARRRGFRPHLEALEARYCLRPGALDWNDPTSFGMQSNDMAFGVAVQADGKIVAPGTSYTNGSYYLDVTRYNSNGTLDN